MFSAHFRTAESMKILLKPAIDGHRTGSVWTAAQNPARDIPVVKGPKSLTFDAGKVADEGRRKRILANREGAKRSRQRSLAEARAMQDDLARLEDENNTLREANVALKRRITQARGAIASFHSFAPYTTAHCAGVMGTRSAIGSKQGLSAFGELLGIPKNTP